MPAKRTRRRSESKPVVEPQPAAMPDRLMESLQSLRARGVRVEWSAETRTKPPGVVRGVDAAPPKEPAAPLPAPSADEAAGLSVLHAAASDGASFTMEAREPVIVRDDAGHPVAQSRAPIVRAASAPATPQAEPQAVEPPTLGKESSAVILQALRELDAADAKQGIRRPYSREEVAAKSGYNVKTVDRETPELVGLKLIEKTDKGRIALTALGRGVRQLS